MGAIPDDREYTASHEWVRLESENAVIGVTDQDPFLSESIEEIFLPEIGRKVKIGDLLVRMRTKEAERILFSPLSATVAGRNEKLLGEPNEVRRDPYTSGWLLTLRVEAGEELEHLLEPTVYRRRTGGAFETEI